MNPGQCEARKSRRSQTWPRWAALYTIFSLGRSDAGPVVLFLGDSWFLFGCPLRPRWSPKLLSSGVSPCAPPLHALGSRVLTCSMLCLSLLLEPETRDRKVS